MENHPGSRDLLDFSALRRSIHLFPYGSLWRACRVFSEQTEANLASING